MARSARRFITLSGAACTVLAFLLGEDAMLAPTDVHPLVAVTFAVLLIVGYLTLYASCTAIRPAIDIDTPCIGCAARSSATPRIHERRFSHSIHLGSEPITFSRGRPAISASAARLSGGCVRQRTENGRVTTGTYIA